MKVNHCSEEIETHLSCNRLEGHDGPHRDLFKDAEAEYPSVSFVWSWHSDGVPDYEVYENIEDEVFEDGLKEAMRDHGLTEVNIRKIFDQAYSYLQEHLNTKDEYEENTITLTDEQATTTVVADPMLEAKTMKFDVLDFNFDDDLKRIALNYRGERVELSINDLIDFFKRWGKVGGS